MNKTVLIFYSLFLFLFTAFTYLFIDPNFMYLKHIFTGIALRYQLEVTSLYCMAVIVFFAFYLYFLRKIKDIKHLKAILLVTFFILIFSYPAILSYDIFNYAATAKVTYFYHENPYLVMPNEFIGDPVLLFTRATNKTALYGPMWIIFSSIPYVLGFGNYLVSLFLFKLLSALFYFGVVWIIYKLSHKSLSKTLFFALNPLVLIETFVSGHNDVVMVFLALYSLYLLRERRKALSGLFLALSILIKYATIFLLPVWMYIFYLNIKKKYVDWNSIYFYSLICMFSVFLLSPLREEMYPWYAIWFIPFAALVENKAIKALAAAFSFGLMLRYIPYMLLGTYTGPAPILRILLMLLPVLLFLPVVLVSTRKELLKFKR